MAPVWPVLISPGPLAARRLTPARAASIIRSNASCALSRGSAMALGSVDAAESVGVRRLRAVVYLILTGERQAGQLSPDIFREVRGASADQRRRQSLGF